MSTQPEALELADALEDAGKPAFLAESAAAELRRLHEENNALLRERDEARRTVRDAHEAGTRLLAQRDALLEALRPFAETDLTSPTVRDTFGFNVLFARAAIAKAEGK